MGKKRKQEVRVGVIWGEKSRKVRLVAGASQLTFRVSSLL